MADRSGAALTVTYVNDPLLVTAAATALRDRGLVQRSARELERFVDRALPGASGRIRLTSRVSIGSAPAQILEAARSVRADLIVMGTRGLTGAARWFVGSTTNTVLQRTRVPVLVVPPSGRASSRQR
jgi:nucleotide-binding universal stress UspA family protein